MTLLSANLLARLERLQLANRRRLAGGLAGEHRSPRARIVARLRRFPPVLPGRRSPSTGHERARPSRSSAHQTVRGRGRPDTPSPARYVGLHGGTEAVTGQTNGGRHRVRVPRSPRHRDRAHPPANRSGPRPQPSFPGTCRASGVLRPSRTVGGRRTFDHRRCGRSGPGSAGPTGADGDPFGLPDSRMGGLHPTASGASRRLCRRAEYSTTSISIRALPAQASSAISSWSTASQANGSRSPCPPPRSMTIGVWPTTGPTTSPMPLGPTEVRTFASTATTTSTGSCWAEARTAGVLR